MMKRLLFILILGGCLSLPSVWAQSAPTLTPDNAAQIAEIRVLSGHSDDVQALAWSPDGARLVSGGSDGFVRLWEVASGATLYLINGHENTYVVSVGFSPDGARIASGGLDNQARWWEAATGAPLAALSGHTGDVWGATWDSSGRYFLTESDDASIRLWDGQTGAALTTLESEIPLYAGVWQPGATLFAVSGLDNRVSVWDASTASLLSVWEGEPGFTFDTALAWVGSSGRLAAVSGSTLYLWDVTSTEAGAVIPVAGQALYSVAASPDGRLLAVGDAGGLITLLDASTGAPLHTLSGHSDLISELAFSPDGSLLASASLDDTIRIWGLPQ